MLLPLIENNIMKAIRSYSFFSTLFITLLLSGCGQNDKAISQASSEASSESTTETKKLSIAGALRENDHLPIEKRIALYRQLKKEKPDAYNFENEDEMTMYGYSFLWDGKVEEAIEVFKLIVEFFPNSANPYDSLGEGYLVNGDTELALANYQKTLEMNPDNFFAEDQIYRIEHPGFEFEKDVDKFAKTYSKEAYREDLDQLGKRLIEVNPSALKFISEEDFWNTIEEKKALVNDSTTYSEFRWHCHEVVANVNCSHTSISRFMLETEMLPIELRFPIQTRQIDGRLYVTDPLVNNGVVAAGDEIESINGVSVAMVIENINKHLPTQGHVETTKRHQFNLWSTGLIPYALNFPTSYEVVIKGKEQPLTLAPAQKLKDPAYDYSIPYCNEGLCFETLEDGTSAVLSISTFNYYTWNNYDEFTAFMDKTFKQIFQKGIEHLIIDLRFNGGGSPESSIYLLKYLIDEPFYYFAKANSSEGKELYEPHAQTYDGKLYFIIDGNGNSTTGHFMAMAKHLELGTIIGEELGSNQFCTAGQTVCRLKNTRLQYNVANTPSRLTITSLPDEQGILPDHYVHQTINEHLNHIDAVMLFTQSLIAD